MNAYRSWYRDLRGSICPPGRFPTASIIKCILMNLGNDITEGTHGSHLRSRLVEVALEWQRTFGVAPAITSAISELDGALLVGMTPSEYASDCQCRTAVTRGCDFTFRERRYQVKANRPSGKPGSFVTLVGKANNYEWDLLIWILYDKQYQICEAWEWTVESYRLAFGSLSRLSPVHMRQGRQLA